MKIRDLAWGVALWPLTAVTALLITVSEWDMTGASVRGVLLGMALAYALCGALVWLPAGAWLSRRVRTLPLVARGVIFAAFGYVLGAIAGGLLVLWSGNASWPHSLNAVLEQATFAAVASLLGWILAKVIDARASAEEASPVG